VVWFTGKPQLFPAPRLPRGSLAVNVIIAPNALDFFLLGSHSHSGLLRNCRIENVREFMIPITNYREASTEKWHKKPVRNFRSLIKINQLTNVAVRSRIVIYGLRKYLVASAQAHKNYTDKSRL
jgi:hypothetical protein